MVSVHLPTFSEVLARKTVMKSKGAQSHLHLCSAGTALWVGALLGYPTHCAS